MHVLDANELFGITAYTYDRIMEVGGKNWPDAFALYFKLLKQSRMQQTNITYSLNSFLKNGLWWGDDRLKNAKKILKELWLVDDVVVRNDRWIIEGHYIRVNYLIDENKVRTQGITYNLSTKGVHPGMDETHNWDWPTSGQTDTNALNTKYINAWSTKKENSSLINKEQQSWDLEKNSLSLLDMDVVDKEKEKSSAKKEKERESQPQPQEYGNRDVNNLIRWLRWACEELGVAYDSDNDRNFAYNLLRKKDYEELCKKEGQDKVEFAINILKASVWLWYYVVCSWPKLIYRNYADVYNKVLQKKNKNNIPKINVL